MPDISKCEYLDVFDEADNLIWRAPRNVVHEEGYIHRSVFFYLFDEGRERLFVTQRSKNKEFYKLYWSIIFGGHVLSGDTYDATVLRELDEECDITGEHAFSICGLKKRFDAEDRENVKVYGFETNKQPVLCPDEFVKGQFVEVGRLQQFLAEKKTLPETGEMYRNIQRYGLVA